MNEFISNHFRLYAGSNTGTGTLSDISTETYSNIKFTGAGAVTINGFANPVEEKVIFIHNLTGATLTIKNLTGTAAYQINTGLGVDFSLGDDASISLIYIGGQWRPLSPLSLGIAGVQSYVATPASTIQFNLGPKVDFLYGKYILNLSKSTPEYYASELLISASTLASGFNWQEYAVIGEGISFTLGLNVSGANLLLEITNTDSINIDVILDSIVSN